MTAPDGPTTGPDPASTAGRARDGGTSLTGGLTASFLGVPVRTVAQVRDGDVVVVGAPFDWGASDRPGARFGPRAIRAGDYLPPDGSRPHLTAGVDPLVDLPVVDVGDVVRAMEHDPAFARALVACPAEPAGDDLSPRAGLFVGRLLDQLQSGLG